MQTKQAATLHIAYPRQNRPSPGQNRQGSILLYVGSSDSNRPNYAKYLLLFSLYSFLTDIGLFWGTLWHVQAMVFNMSSNLRQLIFSLSPGV